MPHPARLRILTFPFRAIFFRIAQTSPVFAETTQIKRVVRYLDRLKSIQACLLHHARDPSRRVHLPLTVPNGIYLISNQLLNKEILKMQMFDDVIESQSHVLCYKLAQADDAAGRGSPALAQLVAVLHEWRDDAVMNTLASVAGKAHDPRTRLRAFVLFGDICGRATERFIKLALERVDCDPALKVRTAALQSIADIMPTVVESADLAPLTPSIGKQLVDVANKDSVSKMRAGAVRVLAEAFEPNRSIVAVAVARVNDKEALVREAACEVLKGM